MDQYEYSANYDDHLLAELYDQSETVTEDVDLLRKLIAGFGPLKIWEHASKAFEEHPLSTTLSEPEIERWLAWATNMAQQFQRSSSAVEGRNGCLSQMYHNGRGFSEKRLKSLTVIHNYDLKRADGTTSAARLFEMGFPDLFSWLLDKMGSPPLPRKNRERVFSSPLPLSGVPC